MPTVLLAVGIAYLIGSLPWALVVARARGVDLRQHGSGSAGATNAWRVLGRGPGSLVFALDFLKGLTAVLLATLVNVGDGLPDWTYAEAWVRVLAGSAAMLGHVVTLTGFALFGDIRGGKGVATGGGMLMGLVPVAVVAGAAVFVLTVATTRYVSLGSIASAVTIPSVLLVRLALGQDVPPPLLWFALMVPFFIVLTHRSNVRRLLAGTESKVTEPAGPVGGAENVAP